MADIEMNPAILGRRLRSTLQSFREDKELTQAEAARRLGWSASKLLRIENGKHGISVEDLEQLLGLYGITDPGQTRDLWSAAKIAASGQRSAPTGRGLTAEYRKYLTFERAASRIKHFEPLLIPGHLQTSEYADAVIRGLADDDDTDEAIAERVAQRREIRAGVHGRTPPPNMHFLIDEAAIHRRIGGAVVMAEQLRHLSVLSRRSNIAIQIIPFELGVHPGLSGPFSLLEFEGPEPAVLYREGGLVDHIDRDGQLDQIQLHLRRFDELVELAAPTAWLDRILEGAIAAMTPFRAPMERSSAS